MLLHSQNMSVTHMENFLGALEGEVLHIRVKNGNISHCESQKKKSIFFKIFYFKFDSRFVLDTHDDILLAFRICQNLT